jgi:prolyl-tRNA synthetase
MLQSALFTKTRKEAPSDEVSKNAELLIKSGFIHKEMAGVYSFLPLGLKVLRKIEAVIRDEINKIGGQEILMSAIQDKVLWERTDRWDDEKVDVWFKSELKAGGVIGFGITHEEPLTRIMSGNVKSYKDLPSYVYQFQNKFRNELRAKSGIMRGREFLMKDLYSFCKNEAEHEEFYKKVMEAYKNIFIRLGLGDTTYLTFASGGIFAKFSHEFQTVSSAGEDMIYVDEKKGIAINKEVLKDEVLADLGINRADLVEKKAIEVGNIFKLGTRFSEALDLNYTDENGKSIPAFMGSYGIGVSRVMGTVVEVLSDAKGMVWPKEISPFAVHVVSLGASTEVSKEAISLYNDLSQKGIEVLLDDRTEASAGEKFADSDLIGIPWRVVVSEKSLKAGGFEVKGRLEDKGEVVSKDELIKILKD